ncbi:MAG: helicase-associated domain-containing protein [Planctomycetota bacterium]
MKSLDLRTLLRDAAADVLRETSVAWLGSEVGNQPDGGKPPSRAALLGALAAAMEDEALVLRRLQQLPRKLQDLLEPFLQAPGTVLAVQQLFSTQGQAFKSRFDLEACLAALQREGLLFPAADKRWTDYGGQGYAVPTELAGCVVEHRNRSRSALKDVITLQGFLDARHFRARNDKAAKAGKNGKPALGGDEKAADHARKIYKLYAMGSAIASRRSKLPPPVAAAFLVSMTKHGGLSTWDELAAEFEDGEVQDQELCRKCLEESMLGTVAKLPLLRLGIQPVESAFVLFHEVVLEELLKHARQHPVEVQEELACGANLASNVGRFLRELHQSKVLFTAEGDLFKASHKRIASSLLPIAGGFLQPEAQLELVYKFCLFRRLIDRRGERALRPTPQGMEFDRAPLSEQQKLLLQHFVEDRSLPGEAFHQVRMRRVLLRLLRRGEPMVWQEMNYLPFLARNAYLAQIDGAQVEEFFAARFQGAGYTPTETLQQMARNLLLWVKRRLYPLGLVDIGLRDGRPVALRLSRLGAELLEAESAAKAAGTRSTVLVNPDFEILLFPGDDVHEAVHAFDRFAKRVKSDHVHQFQLEPATLRAGIAEGLTLDEIVRELKDRARAPVPQNVLYSLSEWAQQG